MCLLEDCMGITHSVPPRNVRLAKEFDAAKIGVIKSKCSTYAPKTGKRCPEEVVDEIDGFPVCEKCKRNILYRKAEKAIQKGLKT